MITIPNVHILHNGWTVDSFYDFLTSQPWTLPDRADDWGTWQNDDGVNTILEENANGWRVYSNGPDIGIKHNTLLPVSGDIRVIVNIYSITGEVTVRDNAGILGTIDSTGDHIFDFTTTDDFFYIKRENTPLDIVIRSVKVLI